MSRIRQGIILLSLWFVSFQSLIGQSRPSFFFSDSLTATEDSYFIYNLIGVRCPGRAVSLSIRPPAGWKLVGTPFRDSPASSDSVSYFPIALMRQVGASADFTRVILHMQFSGAGSDTDSMDRSLTSSISASMNISIDTFFLIRASAIRQFAVSTPQNAIDVGEGEQKVFVPILIKNKGTTTEHYRIAITSSLLAAPLVYKVRLGPGIDSLCNIPVTIPRVASKGSQRLLARVSDETGTVYSLPITVSSLRENYKAHATPYTDFPAELETGIMLTDKQLTYFGAVKGSWSIPQGSVDFSFRSKQYGFANTLERNVFFLQAYRKGLNISFGQLSASQHFFSYGRGIKVVTKVSSSTELGAQMILRSLPGTFSNNFFSVWWQEQKSAKRFHYKVAANFDVKKGLNEYLFFHENEWVINQKMRLTLSAGLGWEQFLRIPVSTNGKPGLGGGYRFLRNGKRFEWISTWQHFPTFFPGIDKGLTNHQHQVRWLIKQTYVDLFYTNNFIVNTILTDTVYYTDAFRFNIKKIGIRTGYRNDQLDLSFSTGLLEQTGVAAAQLPRYQFGEVFFSFTTKEGGRFNIKSLMGYADNEQIDRPVFIHNTSFSYQRKGSGVRAFFLQQPVLKDSTIKVLLRMNQTLLIGPFVSFRLWKQVGVNLRYSVSKTRFDSKITSSASLNASWRQPSRGWELAFSGTFPFSRSMAPAMLGVNIPFFSLSIKKSLRVPILFKRRYHRLDVVAYEDANSNKNFDSGDRLLPGVKVRVNKEDFVTGIEGAFHWRNIDTGFYRLTVMNPSAHRGLLPPPDSALAFVFQSNKEIMIPFSKSCVVSGKVRIELDDHSTQVVSPEHILVKAIDSSGTEYSTLTDEQGSYFINLPAGLYTVTLNQEAFSGTIKPVTPFYRVDLRSRLEAEVIFLLREKKRPIRFLKH